ncbi:MAG: FAD-dependent oxidoreductase, partial [Cruoricaptor ignavus]|nr:FAD-dependent oxidoreductase [Cruoricaptor ignavus]
MKTEFENIIIGFGKAGKTLAAYLAQQGETVALVEKSKEMYGGTCINIGCIPTKSLITNAEKNIPYNEAIAIKNNLIEKLRASNYNALSQLETVEVIDATASFVSEKEIELTFADGSKKEILGDKIFINTGTIPFIPNIEGINSKNIFDSTGLINTEILPEKLLIVGAGFIGLEFASMYAKFGSEVTVLDNNADFLAREDSDVSAEIHHILTENNIKIIQNASVQKFENEGENVVATINIEGENVKMNANAVLIATGRKPNVEKLNLQNAGVETNERGFVKVNDKLQTNIPNIWALGDVNGGPQFTYISLDDFRIVKGQLSGNEGYNSLEQRSQTAFSVFISPPFSHVGMKEKDAEKNNIDFKVYKLPTAKVPKANILQQTEGFLKAVVNNANNEILGITLICPESHEIINIATIAVNEKWNFERLRDMI